MGYRSATFKGTSSVLVSKDEDGNEFESDLEVIFNGISGSQAHPYGSTVAHEPISEIAEPTEYKLDDEPVTLQYLNDTYGEENVSKAVDAAADNAEEEL